MNKCTLAGFAAALMLGACSAAAQQDTFYGPASMSAQTNVADPVAHAEPTRHAQVSCDVRARRTANGMLIEARALAERSIEGEYSLTITKSGGGNSSDIRQGGPLSLAPGEAATLGQNEITVERGARVRATLTLFDDHGEICRETFRL